MADFEGRGPRSDVAFTPSVKTIQSARGSRRGYEHRAGINDWEADISEGLQAFIESTTTAFLATATAEGQPYVQHRGGPPGFLRVLDKNTVGFVDFSGNRQFITTGNLAENDKVHLFLVDYFHRQRVKIWGRAKVVKGDADLVSRLMPKGYRARAEQVILLTVTAWDVNCPQHIPQMMEVSVIREAIEMRDERIRQLEAQLAEAQGSAE